jgi:hypothetical protein
MAPARSIAALVLLTSVFSPSFVSAQPSGDGGDEKVAWREGWPRFRGWEYALTGGALAGLGSIVLFAGRPEAARPYRNPFDDAMRDAFKARTREGRDRSRYVGDAGFRFLNVYPYFDSLAVAGLVHGSGDVALQTALISTESFAIAGFVAIGFERLVGRARPSAAECSKDPAYESYCGDADLYSGLLSGHTAIAFAGAGLTCVHHENLPLYGGPGDVAACVSAFGVAISSGVARIVNDRHWTSDIVLAAALGTTTGYVLPTLLHYPRRPAARRSHGSSQGPHVSVLPSVGPGRAFIELAVVN